MINIIKRDETIQGFNMDKVDNAARRAFASCNQEMPEKFLEQLHETFNKVLARKEARGEMITVEECQDLIRDELIKRNKNEVVDAFISYRRMRDEKREAKTPLVRNIAKALMGTNIQNQNANVDEESAGGRQGEAMRVVSKNDALKNRMSRMSRRHHEMNEIYIHDLDSYSVGLHNCLTMPLDKLLRDGFKTRQTDVRPAASVNTAMQLVAVLFQLQSLNQFGGVSASHIDWTMVPYVRKSFMKHYITNWIELRDEFSALNVLGVTFTEMEQWTSKMVDVFFDETKLTEDDFTFDNDKLDNAIKQRALLETKRETYQAVEGLYHNLNTLQSRSGNQLPFTSINYGTCTLPEGRMVIKALLEVSIKGLGRYGKTSIFPCGIFQVMKGVNKEPGTPNYDLKVLAMKSTAQRIYPNYVNVDWSVNEGYDRNDPATYVSTMGCRTYNGADINAEPGTNVQYKDGRGNICPVTIILPTIAMEARQNVDKFMNLLDKMIADARDMLIERFNWICKQDWTSAKFMWENNTMLGYKPEEGIVSAMKHGTLVIGQLGLSETLYLLIGKDHTTPEGMELAKRIESLFKKRCAEYKKEYRLNFGVYYTPAENLCYTAMKKFKTKYGDIENVTYINIPQTDADGNVHMVQHDKPYFTNSIHVPVYKKLDAFQKIDIESQLTGYSNAGCITYVELDASIKNNIDALEEILDYALDKDCPYVAFNVPIDYCENCGHSDDIPGDTCPLCGSSHISRLRRVTGYLTGDYKTAFNYGKQMETDDRVKHTGIKIV